MRGRKYFALSTLQTGFVRPLKPKNTHSLAAQEHADAVDGRSALGPTKTEHDDTSCSRLTYKKFEQRRGSWIGIPAFLFQKAESQMNPRMNVVDVCMRAPAPARGPMSPPTAGWGLSPRCAGTACRTGTCILDTAHQLATPMELLVQKYSATPGLRTWALDVRVLSYVQMWHQMWVLKPNQDS